jgi:hypothetical protein
VPAPYNLTPGLVQLHTAATTGNGGIILMRGLGARLTITLQSTGTTSGGTLQIEEAYFNPDVDGTYAGTWSAVGAVINASAFTGGAQTVVHAVGSFWAVRCRITANITGGGTVSVWAWGN